jgi:hypothetical protein
MRIPRVHRSRPSPALVVACLALAVSLGGTSYAAVSLPRNSVGTKQLRDNAVTSPKIRDFSLRVWDFKRGQLPRGPAGPVGPAGQLGPLTVRATSTMVPGNAAGNGLYSTRAIQVTCQSGERAVAGGTSWSTDANAEELVTVYSRPLMEDGRPLGWRARGGTDVSGDRIFNVQVLCAKA